MTPHSKSLILGMLNSECHSTKATILHLEFQLGLREEHRVIEMGTQEIEESLNKLKPYHHNIAKAIDEVEKIEDHECNA